MIVVRIIMGLGNQMFQYAAALALSLEKKVPLMVETASYKGYDLRRYELDIFFDIDTPVISENELLNYTYHHPVKQVWNKLFPSKKMRVFGLRYEEPFFRRTLLKTYDAMFPPNKRKTYQETEYHYNKNFFETDEDVYLQGLWMSWKYFENHDSAVRKAFTIRRNLVQHLDKIVAQMQQQNSISIHIRRTDITDPRIVALKGAVPVSFYKEAIALLQKKYDDCNMYFFSDDIDWVKENIQLKKAQVFYVDKTVTKSAIEDFYLMTKCKHNVIANSTFSWWAAYLNNNTDKTVIAPHKWYASESIYRREDIYPSSWITIDW